MEKGGPTDHSRVAEVALALMVAAVVGMMIVPLPTALLDLLIASNIALAVVMLLSSLYLRRQLSFAALPTALLLSTLYRLALNVSSTRLILLQADAGQVIEAFGHFVVQGNYVVGAVVFLILTLVQFVVVARGAERVAEVGARFSLDAMPGRQLAIDADLRSGALDLPAAQAARATLQRESQFYGAMDGAMKFVRGDAIAGLCITVINLLAGIAIGTGMQGMPVLQSVQVYGLLTIGDGLVSQLPALLISTAAGIVVTRVSPGQAATSLGAEMAQQLLGERRVLLSASALLLALAAVPGLPTLPFFALAAAAGFAGYRARATEPPGTDAIAGALAPQTAVLTIAVPADTHARLRPLLDAGLEALRERVFRARGLRLPTAQLTTRDDAQFTVSLHELEEARGPLSVDVEPEAAVATLLSAVEAAVARRAASLVDLQVVQDMLDRLQRLEPARVQTLVPAVVGLPMLTDVLRRLAEEGVSIRPLGEILDAVAALPAELSAQARCERVRARLGRRLTHALAREGRLSVHPLDSLLEDAIRDGIRQAQDGPYLALGPELADDFVQAVRDACQPGEPAEPGQPTEPTEPGELARQVAVSSGHAQRPVVLTQADTRPFVFELLRESLPGIAVVSYAELAPELRVDQGAPISPR